MTAVISVLALLVAIGAAIDARKTARHLASKAEWDASCRQTMRGDIERNRQRLTSLDDDLTERLRLFAHTLGYRWTYTAPGWTKIRGKK